MNVTENRSKNPCDIIIQVPKSPVLSTHQHGLKSPRLLRKMSKTIHSLTNTDCKVRTIKKGENQESNDDGGEKLKGESSVKNVSSKSNDYLLNFSNQDVNTEPNSNHKFYGCRKKEYPAHCESFGLPDDPIFSNSPVFRDRIKKSPLDTDLADPWDISVVNLKYIDQPWLIENPEVITPYWDVQSLFPFEVEDIRQKREPDIIDFSNQSNESNDFSNNGLLDSSNEQDNVFTSTPLKHHNNNQNSGVSLVSTINIANQDQNVDISVLKDQVIKALEEAIKKKSVMKNIDMKIQIVADLSPETSLQKSSVEVRINENIETESCQSSSSSKENYLKKNTKYTSKKLEENSGNSSSFTLSILKKDWHDSQEIILTDQQDLSENETYGSSSPEKKAKSRKNGRGFTTIRRNLRSANVSKIPIDDDKVASGSSFRETNRESKTELDANQCLPKMGSSLENTPNRKTLKSSFTNEQLNQNGTETSDCLIVTPKSVQLEVTKPLSSPIKRKERHKNNKIELNESETSIKRDSNADLKKGKQLKELYILDDNYQEFVNKQKTSSEVGKVGETSIQIICSKQSSKSDLRQISPNRDVNSKRITRSSDVIKKEFLPKEIVEPKLEVTTDDIDRRITRKWLRNDLSQSSQSESDMDNSIVQSSKRRGRPRKKWQFGSNMEKGKSIEQSGSKDIVIGSVDLTQKTEEKVKHRTHGIIPKRLSNDIRSSPEKHNTTPNENNDVVRRKLRSSNQGLKEREAVERRSRTFSSSLSEKNNIETVLIIPSRKRSVSANFDTTKMTGCLSPIGRTLRSQATEPKSSVKLNLLKYNKIKKTLPNYVKSPKISFDLNTFHSPRNSEANTKLKSILKNVSNGEINLSNIPAHQERIVKVDSGDGFDEAPKLERQDGLEDEDKKEESKLLLENGFTSKLNVVINPKEIKEGYKIAQGSKKLPLTLAVPRKLNRIKTTSKHTISQQNQLNEINTDNLIDIKDIKNENIDYSLGTFVWAQVAKYPYWPAVICKDPITETFYNEVQMKNKPLQTMYHIRFFGDSGKRAWVNRIHLMLYCSKHDLEMIANKLKSESKNSNVIKQYLVYGPHHTIDKWNKANEEIESLKGKTYEEVLKYLLDSYESYVSKRREKRKLNMLDASSESESEEPEISGKPRRKRFKSSHITAEHSVELNEINLSVGTKNKAIEIIDICSEIKPNIDAAIETSIGHGEKKFRRSLKGGEIEAPLEIIDKYIDQSDLVKVAPRRSMRSTKPVEKLNMSDFQSKSVQSTTQETLESAVTKGSTQIKTEEEKLPNLHTDSMDRDSTVSKKLSDEASEVGSKTSSSGSSNPNMYSFEYQLELHKKNTLFNGLRKVRVCDYCLKQGDLYKCKGKCGGRFHLECASRVMLPREKQHKKREKSPTKARSRPFESSADSTPKARNGDCCKTRSQSQCQIITIKSKHVIDAPKKDNLPVNFHQMSIAEQIDYGMKELMSKFENRTMYHDSTDSSSEEGSINPKKPGIMDSPVSTVTLGSEKSAAKHSDNEETIEEEKSSDDLEVSVISESASSSSIRHVTADSVILTEVDTPIDITNVKCTYCRLEKDPPCFSCGLEISKRGDSGRQKCSQFRCGRFYHLHCLKMWPQTQWSVGKWCKNQPPEDCFTCPAHTCHTCFSEELGSTAACRLPGDKLARCLLCPAAFHTTTFCTPAGSDILGGSQIVCPRHRSKPIQPINTVWCFICSEGGNLVCCDTCPTSVHPECQPVNFTDDDKYICEDCESGRFPLYDEIVWVKLGQYRWWPAIVLFPNEVPENVRILKHQRGDFVVRFFGTHDHYWVNKARSFLFQEGDRGGSPGEASKSKNKVYETFGKAIEDAAIAYKLKKEFKLRREAECINNLKPPPYIRINKNRPVGNVKCIEFDLSNATACECDPNKPHPCGPDSNCINRLLMTECDPDVCSAGIRCRNQSFQKREYPPMVPYKTQGRGWGLKTLAPVKTNQFIIEYVGELVDSEEYQRRIRKMHEKKEENYYFMTVDGDRMIDAGPKGNLSRFMNHSCNPNCVTQKWTVKGDTRVGLFAKCNIETGSELTFNYNLEVVGQEKKVCKCGAPNCSGYIGVKAKLDKPEKSQTDTASVSSEHRRSRKSYKKRAVTPPLIPPCFMCGRKKSDITCNNKFCNKGYHIKCLKLDSMPEVSKYACPRHNCNLCSNRTIRCCVKCTNSFCPSHSEGNVRHDKFLGFVCRLHDPGISSTDEPSETVKEVPKQKANRKRRLSLLDGQHVKKISNNKDALRAMWRKRKRIQREIAKKQRLLAAKRDNLGILQAKAVNVEEKKKKKPINKKQTTSQASTLKIFNGCIIPKRRLSLSIRQNEASARLHRYSKKYGLTKLNEKTQTPELANEIQLDQIQEDNITSLPEMSVILETTNEICQVNSVETAETHVATSEIDVNTCEEALVNPSSLAERSEFETCKNAKRRRSKLDSTDESAVSSTTSDEGSNSKPSIERLKSDRIFDVEKDDQVSSSPTKHMEEPLLSEDELSLDLRLKMRSTERSRKKSRFSIKRFSSTAKPS